ncbi:hypothetical protein [Chloroflexus sp. MS-G]|uniref:hypothetical protein n=1 Tax=Chloroflexus sp. MS-G TaxID=1521187 RepID=UPI0004DF5E3A|nr:hypothetical protein [Chloroflexus sp. MS-G]
MDAGQSIIGADDVFVIMTLPEGCAECVPQSADPCGGDGFALTNDGADGIGIWPARVLERGI